MYIVDRIYDDIAVLEDGETKIMIDVLVSMLPDGIKEGSVLDYFNDEYVINTKLEDDRRKRLQDKFNRLKKN